MKENRQAMCSLRCWRTNRGSNVRADGGVGSGRWDFAFEVNEKPPPREPERGALQPERDLVVVVGFGRCSVVEVARRTNLLLAGEGSGVVGGFVPDHVVDGVRIFGVRLLVFAGENLRLLLHPASHQS